MYSFPSLEAVLCSMSGSNCCFLTFIQDSQEASQVVWYSRLLKNFPQFVVIHTVKVSGTANKAKLDVFLKFSCFFYDPADVGNLISGSSVFSKSNLNIWKFLVHILLKPSLENVEHYFARVVKWVQLWDNLNILCLCLSLGLEWKLTFSTLVATAEFQIWWHIECSTLIESSFRIWNRSAGIPLPQ